MTVSFSKWIKETYSHLRAENRSIPSRLAKPLYYVYVGALLSATKHYRLGTNVFDRDWDLLIILDACRVDALHDVADEYDFVNGVESMTSVGSTSFEWMTHTFDRGHQDEIARTSYITSNGYTQRVMGQRGDTGHAAIPFGPTDYDVVRPENLGYLEELWRTKLDDDFEWIVGSGDNTRQSPRYTTDRAISAGRTADTDRLMVHYMYPHDPFPLAEGDLFEPFDPLRVGDVSRESVWDAYLDNLRFVLDEVGVLLENVDAETVVITADHGEAFGEYGFYKHVVGCPLPCMRRVPWATTTATDSKSYEPTAPEPQVGEDTVNVEERLRQLGYV
jgi:hypothetical protein